MRKSVNIVTVLKAGGDFHIADVKLLADNLRVNAGNLDVTIYCLTDLAISPITNYGIKFIPIPDAKKGWWAKLELFNPALEDLRPFLYMDLDTAIIGDYSELFPEDNTKFITLSDFYRPSKSASALMWVPALCDKVKAVWTAWIKHPKLLMKIFRGDQDFIFDTVEADIKYQNITNIITSFKPNKIWLREQPKESVICFHGQPRIPKATETIEWVKQYVEGEL